jgi:hypothetical protein
MAEFVSTQDQKILDLIRALRQESESVGGFGDISVKVTFHAGLPVAMEVMERRRRYRLGGGGEHAT